MKTLALLLFALPLWACAIPTPEQSVELKVNLLKASAQPGNEPPKASAFEAAISLLAEEDPRSPEALSARLEYADFLVGETDADCAQRLAAAQSQLDIVASRRGLDLILPLGPARIADGKYRIRHLRCSNS
jgi:hypothetical protein